MCYSNKDQLTIDKIIDKLDPHDKLIQYEFRDKFKLLKSNCFLIFLTKEFKESSEFNDIIEYVKLNAKKILIVWLDREIFTDARLNNEFQVICFNEDMSLELKTEAIKRIDIFLNRLAFKKPTFSNIKLDFKLYSIKQTGCTTFNNQYEIIPENEVIIVSPSSHVSVYNFKTGELLSRIAEAEVFVWIEHLNQIIIPDYNNNTRINPEKFIFNKYTRQRFYEKTGTFVRDIAFGNSTLGLCMCHSMKYNKTSYEFYMHIEKCELEKNELILMYDKNFNLIQLIEKCSIADLIRLTNVISISNRKEYQVFENPQKPVIVFLQNATDGIQILNTNSFSIVSSIKNPFSIKKILNNNKILLTDLNGNFFIYTFQITNLLSNDYLIDKFACKLDKLNYHLYKRPVLLPCGNSACYECIYENYNFYNDNFKCNFDSCQQVHKLPNNLEKDLNLIHDMKENGKEILEYMFMAGNKIAGW